MRTAATLRIIFWLILLYEKLSRSAQCYCCVLSKQTRAGIQKNKAGVRREKSGPNSSAPSIRRAKHRDVVSKE